MNKKLIFGGIGLVAIGYALYKYFSVQSKLLMDYEYKIVNIKPIKISLTELTFDITIRFISKSDIEAEIQQIYLDVFAEGNPVGFVTENKPFIIPAKGSSDISLRFSFEPKKILSSVTNILLGAGQRKDLKFKLQGYATVKSGFIKKTLPISYENVVSAYI